MLTSKKLNVLHDESVIPKVIKWYRFKTRTALYCSNNIREISLMWIQKDEDNTFGRSSEKLRLSETRRMVSGKSVYNNCVTQVSKNRLFIKERFTF